MTPSTDSTTPGAAHRIGQALALGAGLGLSLGADAAMVISTVGVTLTGANGNFQSYNLDLDGNGTQDFTVSIVDYSANTFVASVGTAFGGPKNPWVSYHNDSGGNRALDRFGFGDVIDAATFHSDGAETAELFQSTPVSHYGNWYAAGTHGYVGLMLVNDTGTHYGWLEVTHGSAILGNMGYQTTAGAGALIGNAPTGPTPAPEPGSLALVALGGAGIAALRRRRAATAAH